MTVSVAHELVTVVAAAFVFVVAQFATAIVTDDGGVEIGVVAYVADTAAVWRVEADVGSAARQVVVGKAVVE